MQIKNLPRVVAIALATVVWSAIAACKVEIVPASLSFGSIPIQFLSLDNNRSYLLPERNISVNLLCPKEQAGLVDLTIIPPNDVNVKYLVSLDSLIVNDQSLSPQALAAASIDITHSRSRIRWLLPQGSTTTNRVALKFVVNGLIDSAYRPVNAIALNANFSVIAP